MNTAGQSEKASSTSRKYTRRSESQWRGLIDNFSQSDLTLQTYCQHHKIAPSGFYAWQKRFKYENVENTPKETLVDITPQLNNANPTLSESDAFQVELELGLGYILRIKTA